MKHQKPRIRKSIYGLGLALIVFFNGCSCEKSPATQTVITVENTEISAQELLNIAKDQGEYASERQLLRLAEQTAEELAAEQKLMVEGWHKDADFIQAQRRFIRAYVNSRIQEELATSLQVSDEEIANYFENHRNEYRKPDQIRVAIIHLSTERHGTQAKALANHIHAALHALPNGVQRDQRFNEFVVAHSAHVASRFQGGDIGYVEQGDPSWPKNLVQAAFTLPKDASLGPLVETADGFYIFRVFGYSEAIEPRLEDYKQGIYQKLLSQKQDILRDTARIKLVEGINIEIDEDLIQSIASPSNQERPTPSPSPAG